MEDILMHATIATEIAGRRVKITVPVKLEGVTPAPTTIDFEPTRSITVWSGTEDEPARPLDLPAKECVA